MDVKVNSPVTVEIKSRPHSEAGRKTLVRVISKDPAVNKAKRTRKTKRPSLQQWRRGGCIWNHRMKSSPMVDLAPGAKYEILATLDVVRDLESIAPYVDVKAR